MSIWASWAAPWNGREDPWFDVAIPVFIANDEALRICINDEDIYLTLEEVGHLREAVSLALRKFASDA